MFERVQTWMTANGLSGMPDVIEGYQSTPAFSVTPGMNGRTAKMATAVDWQDIPEAILSSWLVSCKLCRKTKLNQPRQYSYSRNRNQRKCGDAQSHFYAGKHFNS